MSDPFFNRPKDRIRPASAAPPNALLPTEEVEASPTDRDMLAARFAEMEIELDNTGKVVLTSRDLGDLQCARRDILAMRALAKPDED